MFFRFHTLRNKLVSTNMVSEPYSLNPSTNQDFFVDPESNLDPEFYDQKYIKFKTMECFVIKNLDIILFLASTKILRHMQKKPLANKSLRPELQTWIYFLLCLRVDFAFLDLDPDPQAEWNWIRIQNTVYQVGQINVNIKSFTCVGLLSPMSNGTENTKAWETKCNTHLTK